MADAEGKLRSRWLQVCLVALPAILVLVPLLMLMTVGTSTRSNRNPYGSFSFFESFEHGWPFTFLTRSINLPESSTRWRIWQGDKEWHLNGAAGDLLFLAIVIGILTTISFWRAKKNRTWSLTLRECMFLMLLSAVIAGHLGWYVRRGEQAARVGTRLMDRYARVDYEYCGPKWLLRLEGRHEGPIQEYLQLNSIRSIDLSRIRPADMEAARRLLEEVNQPKIVWLRDTEISESALRALLETLARCQPRMVSLNGLKLEGLGGQEWPAELLEPLARNPRLRQLRFCGVDIGDENLAALFRCHQLRSIDLRGTNVTPVGAARLLELPNIEELGLEETAASTAVQEQAAAAGVRLEINVKEAYSPPRFHSGFGGGPPGAAKDTAPNK